LFAIALGLVIQMISIPVYVFTYSSKFRIYAVGGLISKGQMGIVNWAWIGADLALFGELVWITEESNYAIFNNETGVRFNEIIEQYNDCT
jgi:hypothetical protein